MKKMHLILLLLTVVSNITFSTNEALSKEEALRQKIKALKEGPAGFFDKPRVDAEETMQPIYHQRQVEPFAGKVVAYTATTYYLDNDDDKYLLPSSAVLSYGYIENEPRRWSNGKEGYNLHQLLIINGVGGNTALLNRHIKKGNLQMRKITPQEAREIFDAIHEGSAKFSLISNNDNTIWIIRNILKKESSRDELSETLGW